MSLVCFANCFILVGGAVVFRWFLGYLVEVVVLFFFWSFDLSL